MVKKLTISKIMDFYKHKNNEPKKILHTHIEDKFMKNEELTEQEKKILIPIKNLLERVNFTKLVDSLVDKRRWSNSVDFVGFNFYEKNKKIIDVNVGMNYTPGNYDTNTISLESFIDVLTHVTVANIEKAPEKANEYKKLYIKLVNFIKKESQ